MPQTRINCPRCKQPVLAEITQLFDMNTDPQAKQRLLNGAFNVIQCPSCGFQGMMSMPLVYHDPEKGLLLTYFPPELKAPVNEQERQIGPLIQAVINKLPPEKKKGYLLQPQTMFTLQTMLERILEGDGITREMIERQQKQITLIQRLISAQPADRIKTLQQEEALVDEPLFALLNRLTEASITNGDEKSAAALAEVQKDLLANTQVGREIKAQVDETQAAVKSLQEASKDGLTREKLLDLIVNSQSDTRLNALVSFAHSGMDYTFFMMLTEKVEKAQGEEKTRLAALREKLLQMRAEIEKAMEAQEAHSRQLLEQILSAQNIEEETVKSLNEIDELFLEMLKTELQAARKKGDLERIGKLNQVNSVIEQAMEPPAELKLIEQLLALKDEQARQIFFEEHTEEVTPEFLQMFNALINQFQEQGQRPEMLAQLQETYKAVLRFTMKRNMGK